MPLRLDAHPVVSATLAEFRIPLPQPADAVWSWSQADTADEVGEYIWQVAVPSDAGRLAFGFFYYKFPGSRPTRGPLSELLQVGQASVFEEDALSRGTLVADAHVDVRIERNQLVIRLTDPVLIRRIFGKRPTTVTLNTRTPDASFETIAITYRD